MDCERRQQSSARARNKQRGAGHGPRAGVDVGADGAVGGGAARLLASLRQALLPQDLCRCVLSEHPEVVQSGS